jgi:uncharacterized protein (TIGR03066 family)
MTLGQWFLGIAFLLVVTLTAGAGADTAKKLIGVWEMSKAEKLIPGATVEFTPDSKFLMRAKIGAMDLKMDGTFSVKDNVITTIVKDPGGKNQTTKMKIKSLTDKLLVVESDGGQAEEYKKK